MNLSNCDLFGTALGRNCLAPVFRPRRFVSPLARYAIGRPTVQLLCGVGRPSHNKPGETLAQRDSGLEQEAMERV